MHHRLLASVATGAILLSTSSAFAQSQSSDTKPAVPQDALESNRLQDIIVTAQRRSENLQRAAVAITAISADTLRDAGVSRPQELTALVPALQVVTAAGPYSQFYLRGVGNFNANPLSDAAVAFSSDGVFIGRPSSTAGFFYDLERVEVLKGPQGTLYGRNATGGAINVISKAPVLEKFAASVGAEYGNFDALRLDGMINVPLGDKAAFRTAGIYVKHDGYMSDGTDDQRDYGGKASLKLSPTDNLSIVIRGDYFHQGGKGAGATIIALDPDKRIGVSSPEGQAFYQSKPVAIAGRNFAPIPPRQFLDNSYWGISSTIEWNVPAGTITIIPAYRHAKINYVATTAGFQLTQRERDEQFSVEARLASHDDSRIKYLIGMFYYDENNDIPIFSANSQFNESFQTFKLGTKSMATFGQLGYAISDDFKISVGGRYTTEDKSFVGRTLSFNRLCLPIPTARCPNAQPFPYTDLIPPPLLFVGDTAIPQFDPLSGTLTTGTRIRADNRASFDQVTYRLAADWQFTSENLLYVSYETGFKSGGFFFSSDNSFYRPEKIKAFTLGSKNRFFDNRLQLNLEGFYWRYRDQQISHLSQDSKGVTVFATENVGNATLKGAEIEGQFLLTESTLLTADIQYLDAGYKNFNFRVPPGAPPLTGCIATGSPATGYNVNCSGQRPINAPKWTVNLGVQQTIKIGDHGKVVLNARTHYQTEIDTGLDYTPLERQAGYWMSDASVTFAQADDRWSITGFINNIADKTVVGNTFQPPLSNFVTGSLRPPRTYGVRAGMRF